ncbi:MAG: hypothetical protein AAGJ80_09690, partial [Cyanobacteria bacterium J06553_1]
QILDCWSVSRRVRMPSYFGLGERSLEPRSDSRPHRCGLSCLLSCEIPCFGKVCRWRGKAMQGPVTKFLSMKVS